MAAGGKYASDAGWRKHLDANELREKLNIFQHFKRFCQASTRSFFFWLAVAFFACLEPILCAQPRSTVNLFAQTVTLAISSILYCIQLIGVATSEWEKILLIEAMANFRTISISHSMNNFTLLKLLVFFAAEGEYILEGGMLGLGWVLLFWRPGLATLRCFRVFRLLWFYEVEVFKSTALVYLSPFVGDQFVLRGFKVLKFAIKSLTALGNEMFRLTNETRGGLLLMMMIFYSAFVLGASLYVETNGEAPNELCISVGSCTYTLLRLTFFDGNGFDFAYYLTSDHRIIFVIVMVYLCLTSFGMINGLVGIFGTAFANASEIAFDEEDDHIMPALSSNNNNNSNDDDEDDRQDDGNNEGDDGMNGESERDRESDNTNGDNRFSPSSSPSPKGRVRFPRGKEKNYVISERDDGRHGEDEDRNNERGNDADEEEDEDNEEVEDFDENAPITPTYKPSNKNNNNNANNNRQGTAAFPFDSPSSGPSAAAAKASHADMMRLLRGTSSRFASHVVANTNASPSTATHNASAASLAGLAFMNNANANANMNAGGVRSRPTLKDLVRQVATNRSNGVEIHPETHAHSQQTRAQKSNDLFSAALQQQRDPHSRPKRGGGLFGAKQKSILHPNYNNNNNTNNNNLNNHTNNHNASSYNMNNFGNSFSGAGGNAMNLNIQTLSAMANTAAEVKVMSVRMESMQRTLALQNDMIFAMYRHIAFLSKSMQTKDPNMFLKNNEARTEEGEHEGEKAGEEDPVIKESMPDIVDFSKRLAEREHTLVPPQQQAQSAQPNGSPDSRERRIANVFASSLRKNKKDRDISPSPVASPSPAVQQRPSAFQSVLNKLKTNKSNSNTNSSSVAVDAAAPSDANGENLDTDANIKTNANTNNTSTRTKSLSAFVRATSASASASVNSANSIVAEDFSASEGDGTEAAVSSSSAIVDNTKDKETFVFSSREDLLPPSATPSVKADTSDAHDDSNAAVSTLSSSSVTAPAGPSVQSTMLAAAKRAKNRSTTVAFAPSLSAEDSSSTNFPVAASLAVPFSSSTSSSSPSPLGPRLDLVQRKPASALPPITEHRLHNTYSVTNVSQFQSVRDIAIAGGGSSAASVSASAKRQSQRERELEKEDDDTASQQRRDSLGSLDLKVQELNSADGDRGVFT